MTTKYAIVQDILSHEALFRISKLLDQFKDGLKKTPALKLILAFPGAIYVLWEGDCRCGSWCGVRQWARDAAIISNNEVKWL